MESILAPPPPFSFVNNLDSVTSGNLSNEWQKWKKSFMIYYEACELKNKEKTVQVNILLHVIGDQCREVYEQFEETSKDLQSLLKKFDSFFLPKKNLTIERHRFFTRDQRDSESIEQYSFELKKLALNCEFNDLCDDLIKDRLICGIKEATLRERLLREPDLTLKKALEICNVAQISRLQAGTIKKEYAEHAAFNVNLESWNNERETESENREFCHWVARRGRGAPTLRGTGPGAMWTRPEFASRPAQQPSSQYAPRPHNNNNMQRAPPPPQPYQQYNTVRQNKVCGSCGRLHSRYQCPAFGRQCIKCNKYNHFARMCNPNVYEMYVEEEAADQVIYAFNKCFSDWSTVLNINGSDVRFKLDTGADVNVLPRSFLKQIGLLESDLLKCTFKLRAYSGGDIKVLGSCNLKVKFKDTNYILAFVIADVSSPPILGRYSCEELNMVKLVLALDESKNELKDAILQEYGDVFNGIGCMPGEHTIQVDSSVRPVVHAPRKLPVALKDSIKKKLDEMVEQEILTKVEGPTDWVNSMTVVKKANGDLRICLDPQDLNKAIKREHFRLPTLEEITVNLAGSKIFSTVDAKQGFWQQKLHPDCTHLCTFNTPFGRYKFLRLPYGITSASEVFHKKMYEQFDDIQGVCLFIDDLLIYGKTQEEHDQILKKVLDRCREINLKLNKNKCKFGLKEITYLGHKITGEGIYPDESHTSAIRNMPPPQSIKDLERFLGLVNYVGNFVPNLSQKTHVLRVLLKKEIAWHWSIDHQRTFDELKQCLVSVPVLQYYTLYKPVVISVDASKNGLGACLMQDSLPVCYASRSLTKAEESYAQIEKELLACVYACEKFYAYIYGRCDITIETDHKPLVSIISKPIASAPARLQRMLLRLQPYSFKLVYTPGKYLYVADTLSRAVEPVTHKLITSPRDYLETQAQVCALAASNPLTDTHFTRIQKETEKDTELQVIIKYIKGGWPLHKQLVDSEATPYWTYRNDLSVAYGLVWKNDRVVIPKLLRMEMLKKVHIGHLGLEKCKLRIRETMFWPNVTSQLEDLISNCQACLLYKNQNRKETLIPHEVPQRAWSKIGTDIFHFEGNIYLIVIDYYSKYIEVVKIKSLLSECVINELKNIFSRQGIPDVVMSDNGPEYRSHSFQQFSKDWNFNHVTSSPRYPQSNGQAERAVQTIKNILKKTGIEKTDFRLAMLEYHNTPIGSTLPSPSELLNNRKLRSILPCPPKLLHPKIHRYVRQELQNRQNRQKLCYDRGARDMTSLGVGQKVKVRVDGRWVSGTVQALVGIRSYLVSIETGGNLVRNRRHLIIDSELRPELSVQNSDGLAYDDIQPSSSRNGSPCSAQQTGSQPLSQASGIPCQPITNQYITRSGRIPRPPDRWGFQ